jgi:2-polyprenyl-6-methoxyphenol hydroxylase-like FAD-dependent oxidoreductase
MVAVRMADLPATGTDVLVVGAGPTGLMAGLVLTSSGSPTRC